jgi:hypothetical protein
MIKTAKFKMTLWDYIYYFPIAYPFIKNDLVAWWKGLGNDW